MGDLTPLNLKAPDRTDDAVDEPQKERTKSNNHDQNKLVELIQSQGWNSTALKLKGNESGFADDVMRAEIELTVAIDYQDDEDEQNPYRIK
ncbi:hypothetical protein [Haladaptatus salinisoli]|uniref:hypothetical protein n=1 Tax=Haladaptatus salinisoli TaxID=2884876 RepID=UPI001D0BA52A|nr:hypothetical protein [Haladaptatus salinisoli]